MRKPPRANSVLSSGRKSSCQRYRLKEIVPIQRSGRHSRTRPNTLRGWRTVLTTSTGNNTASNKRLPRGMQLLRDQNDSRGHKPKLREANTRGQPPNVRKVDCGEASPQQCVYPDVCARHQICLREHFRQQMKTSFDHPPGKNQHGQEKRHFARPLRFYRQQQHGPEEIEVFLNRKRPIMRSVEAAGFVNSQRPVVAVEKQTTRYIREN